MSPKSNECCLYKQRGHTETHKGDGQLKKEAEIEGMLPQPKEFLEAPELKVRKASSLEPSKGA